MAEPNWELWEQILQGLQFDLSEVKAKLAEHDQRFNRLDSLFDDVEKRLVKQNVQIMHALGQTTDANLQTVLANESIDRLEQDLSPVAFQGVRDALVRLEPGQSYAIATRMLQDTTTAAEIATESERQRNSVTAATARAKAQTGSNFVIEVGEFLTAKSRDIMLCCVITRRI